MDAGTLSCGTRIHKLRTVLENFYAFNFFSKKTGDFLELYLLLFRRIE